MSYSAVMKILLGLFVWFSFTLTSVNVSAALEVETQETSGSCITLVNTLKNRWFDVKGHMQPLGGKIRLPKNEDFRCLHRNVVRSALEKKIVTGANLKCFSLIGSKGLGVCCDNPVQSCAQLNPGLFPELYQDKRAETYEPPKSNWVRPPSESDQWSSNE